MVAMVGFSAAAFAQLKEAFPHVWVDVAAKVVEFEGSVPIVVNDPEAPIVYLEVIVCIPDTKEHETLIVTPARPSHVQAALLMIGLQPGKPGSWTWDDKTLISHDPTGDRLSIEFVYTDKAGAERIATPSQWVMNELTKDRLPDLPFVFAGSRMIDRGFGGEKYDADGTGLLVGLATFGSETIAWPTTFSPDSEIAEPVWIADPDAVPDVDTPVRVRLRAAR